MLRGRADLFEKRRSEIRASVLDGFREFGNVILQFVYQKHEMR